MLFLLSWFDLSQLTTKLTGGNGAQRIGGQLERLVSNS